jgi:hypothetical protein
MVSSFFLNTHECAYICIRKVEVQIKYKSGRSRTDTTTRLHFEYDNLGIH